jgi:hypothetical protein
MVNVTIQLELLGMKAEDKVTGFKGVITSISFDLYGCVQALINPGADKDGKLRDQSWFDVARLTLLGVEPVMDRPDFQLEQIVEGKKGPAEKPAFNKS